MLRLHYSLKHKSVVSNEDAEEQEIVCQQRWTMTCYVAICKMQPKGIILVLGEMCKCN